MPQLLCVVVEAEYAFAKGKQIVPLKLEADYEPDGWLGALTLTRLYYDFTFGDQERIEREWEHLRDKLRREMDSPDTGLPASR